MRFLILLPLVAIINFMFAQELTAPIDVVFDEENNFYYVTNFNFGEGYITKHDLELNIVEIFVDGLNLVGGLSIHDNILYVLDNMGKPQEDLPCYLKAYNLDNAVQIFDKEVAASGFTNLMDKDSNANLYFGEQLGERLMKYNIPSGNFETMVQGIPFIYGVDYHPPSDSLFFISASGSLSEVFAIKAGGNQAVHQYYHSGEIDDLVIDNEDRTLFMTSWESEDAADTLGKIFYTPDFYNEFELSTHHQYPFGICEGKNRRLIVCNTGSNKLSIHQMNTAVEELTGSQLISISPNPNQGIFRLNFPNEEKFQLMEIVSLEGKVLYHRKLDLGITQSLDCKVDFLPAGFYLLCLSGLENNYQMKLIIQ